MYFNAIRENIVLAKISEFTVYISQLMSIMSNTLVQIDKHFEHKIVNIFLCIY